MRLLWTHFLQVSCRHMILLVLLYSFLWILKLSAIVLLPVKKILHLHFFGISKNTWWDVWMIRSTESIGEPSCLTSLVVNTYIRSTYITETFTRLSWTPDKVDENELSLIEKFVCTAYGLHNRCRTSDGNRLRFLLFTKLSDKLRKLPPTKEAL